MNALKRALLLVVVAGAGLSLYFFLFIAPQPVQAFDAILNLSPGELELHCGIPAQDTMGVVADGAGIRDLRYTASGNAEIVFRFISADDKQWQSLGAWEKVHAPDFMGSPVPAQDASRVMGCVTKDARALLAPEDFASGGIAPSLAFVNPQAIQEMMMPAQHQGPPPMPSTLPRSAAQPAHPGSGGAVIKVPESDWSQPPRAYYPEDDDDLPHARSAPRCPAGTGSCNMLDYPEFIETMRQVIIDERQGDFQSAIGRLQQHGVIVVRLPANEQNRVAAVTNVMRFEVKAFNVIEEKLRDDVTRLEPRQGDTAGNAAKKIAEMQREDVVRRALWSRAIEENGPARALSASRETLRFNGDAFERMVQIETSGAWR